MIIKFIKKILKYFVLSPFIILIIFISFFKKIRFYEFSCNAMGAADPIQIYLKEKRLKINKEYIDFFYFESMNTLKDLKKNNKNFFWLKILSREICWINLNNKFLFLIKNNLIFLCYKAVIFFKFNQFLIDFSWIIDHSKDAKINNITKIDIKKIINSNLSPVIELKKEEIEICKKKIIKILKLNNEKRDCVVFHNRDSAYKKILNPNFNMTYHDYRNWDFDDYKKTLEHATKKYFTIRIGNIIEKPSKFKNENFFEYSNSNLVTDELDVYLVYSCKFFVGGGSGIDKVARLFNKPILYVNIFQIPIQPPRYLKKCIFLPAKLFDMQNNKLLTFSQLFDKKLKNSKKNLQPLGRYAFSSDFKDAKIKIIYNTAEDIFLAFKEMEKFIENKLEFDSLDIKLRNDFMKFFPEESINPNEVFISPSFLKNNQNLFG